MLPTLALAAAMTGTLDVADTTSAHLRATTQGAGGAGAPAVGPGFAPIPGATTASLPPVGLDLATQPAATLRLTFPSWDLSLRYAPSVTAFDVETGFVPILFHTGGATVGWHRGSVRVAVTENAAYGE